MVSSLLLGSVNILGGLVFGYNSGVVAVALTHVQQAWGLDSNLIAGFFTSCLLIGAMIGSLFGGAYTDKFGRKISIITVAVLGTIGPIACALVPGAPLLFIARGLLGIGVGLATVACPTYVSENARMENKGSLGTLFQLAITFGIFLSYFMALFPTDGMTHQEVYRWMFGIGAAPGTFLLFLGIFMPESEYWKGLKQNEREALLPSQKGSIHQQEAGFADLFRPPARKSLFIGILLAVAQQLTGINAFMFYAPTIFQSAGFTNTTWPTIGLGGWNFATTLISTFLVDRLGRKPLLLCGTSLMAVGCILLAVINQVTTGNALAILSIVLTFIFIMGFEMGEGPLFWVVCVELFQPEIKGPALSVLNTIVNVFNIMLTFGFLPISDAMPNGGVFWLFGGLGAACVVLMWFNLPETKKANVLGSRKNVGVSYDG